MHPFLRGRPNSTLTEREIEVLKLIAEGLIDREIGARLCISPETVKRHGSNIRNKIGLDNRTEMALFAIRQGLATA